MSGNPNPQHNPTDGLNVAAKVTVSGTGITQIAGPEYSLTLSLSDAGGYSSSVVATAVMEDVAGSAYSPVGEIVVKSYANPSAGSPAWYNPDNFSGYDADIVSVSDTASISVGSETFLITGLAVGQGIVEVQFPTFDNTNGDDSTTGNPKDMIYAQIVVTVIP